MASVALAAFIPAELRPDHLVAAGTLTQAELPARDLGHGRLLLAACPSPHAVTTSGRFSFAGRVARRDQPGWAGATGPPGMRHRGKGWQRRWIGGHTEAPDLSGSHNRHGAAAAAPNGGFERVKRKRVRDGACRIYQAAASRAPCYPGRYPWPGQALVMDGKEPRPGSPS